MFDEKYYLTSIGKILNSKYSINTYDHCIGEYNIKAIDKMIEKAKIEGDLSYDEWDIKKVAEKVAINQKR